jgi:hypothetical protein
VEKAARKWMQKQENEFNRELFSKHPSRWDKGTRVLEDYTGKQ